MSIGEAIKREREKRGITQVQLSERLNIKQQTVSAWERGVAEPNIAVLKQIAKILGCSFGDLIGDSGKLDMLSLADFTPEEREQIKRFCAYIRYMRSEKK